MFIGDFEKSAPWSSASIKGCKRFLDRIWNLQEIVTPEEGYRPALEASMHKTIKKVTEDIENLKFNTAIAAMMALLNEFADSGSLTRGEYKDFLIMLNPFAPHITEEIYERRGFEGMLNQQKWVTYDESKCKDDTIEIVAQVNGKIKSKLTVAANVSKEDAIALAKEDGKMKEAMDGKTVVKEIYVPGKLVNIVVK